MATRQENNRETLYLVYLRGPSTDLSAVAGAVELDDGLYLVSSSETRSRLYHAVKRRHAPDKLLVAPLAALPKFKGLKQGALKGARLLAG